MKIKSFIIHVDNIVIGNRSLSYIIPKNYPIKIGNYFSILATIHNEVFNLKVINICFENFIKAIEQFNIENIEIGIIDSYAIITSPDISHDWYDCTLSAYVPFTTFSIEIQKELILYWKKIK